jgi:hypothetical protein
MKILKKFSKCDNNIVKTPIDINVYMSKNKDKRINQLEYSWIIGSLIDIMNCKRHNIAYLFSKLSRFTNNLSMNHWEVIKRVFKYLRYTLDYSLHYTSWLIVLEWYNDANWISNIKDSKSTSGYVFILGRAIVSWKFPKQVCIIKPTM